MVSNILQVILILVIFLLVRYFAWKFTLGSVPGWLNYKPFNCELCLTFWSLISIYLTIGFAIGLWVTMGGGIALAVLNAIAMWINQKNNTIKIEDV